MTASILKEADRLVNSEEGRRSEYVPPARDFAGTAAIWQALIQQRFGVRVPLDAAFVGLMLAGMKLNREAGRHKTDNLVDLAGYMECVHQIIEHGAPDAK